MNSIRTVRPQAIGPAVFAASSLTLLLMGLVCLIRYGSSFFSVYVLYATGILIIEVYVWKTFLHGHRDCMFGKGSPRLLVNLILADGVIALLAEAGTLIGSRLASPLRLTDWNLGRIAFFFFAAFVITMLFAEFGPRDRTLKKSSGFISEASVKTRLKHVVHLALPVFGYAITFFLIYLFDNDSGTSWIASGSLLAATVTAIIAIAMIALDRKWAPERTFAWVALTMGLAFILPFPVTNLFSWDDEVHYRNANALSYVADSEQSASDRMISTVYTMEDGFSHDASFGRFYTDASQWSDDDIIEFACEFNEQGNESVVISDAGMSSALMRYSSLGYIPSAVGLWLGRLLHLPYALTFVLGRLGNLIGYTIVAYYAIKKIPTKKALLCAVALLPTNIFLAANYSYDPWLTAWLFLAVALTIREIKDPEPLCISRWTLLLLTYFCALGPKAVYFPTIALLMLIPSSKFKSKHQKRQYYIIAITMALLIVGTFALNILLTGGGAGDARGGEGVSTSSQVSGAVQSPLTFVSTIASFLVSSYLTFENITFAFTALAYVGYPSVIYPVSAGILVLLLFALSVVEGSSRQDPLGGVGKSLWTLFLFLATMFLSSVALYLSFTAVGSNTVAGMQPRYMLPLVFPFCALTLNIPHDWRLPDRILLIATFSVSLLYLAAYTWLVFSTSIVV